MSRSIRLNEIVPELLYQRGQFVTFPTDSKMTMLHNYRVDIVVNLWTKPDPELHQKPGLIYIHWPIGGGEAPNVKWPMINMLLHYMRLGHRVLVHCEAGVNRSIWLVSVLKALYEKTSGQDAFAEIVHHVGRTKVRLGLLNDLAQIYKPGPPDEEPLDGDFGLRGISE